MNNSHTDISLMKKNNTGQAQRGKIYANKK